MFEGNFGSKFFTFELDDWVFTEASAREKLLKHFETKNLKGFGVEHLKNGIIASGAILQYLDMTQHYQIGHITSLRASKKTSMYASTSLRYAAWS